MSKQFTVYINWRNKEKGITNEVVLKDGGQPIAEINSYEDAWRLRDILNELHEENKELKQKIESLKMEIAELRESEKDNYNITDGLW